MQKIGIRREDKTEWERRVPLTPEHVRQLAETHEVPFAVQRSPQRVFDEAAYQACGAPVTEDLADCPIIMGVKEIPLDVFEPGKTYVFFSHTIKGQPYNMPMLRRMMELGCNLIDYEKITDDQGRRLVFFGFYAGLAGMIDTLWSLGQRLRVEGRQTPLERIRPAHQYASLDAAREHLTTIARECADGDVLAELGPVVCGFAGYGQVSQGAQDIYSLFEPEVITPDELLSSAFKPQNGRFYQVVFEERHMVRPNSANAVFELQDYYENPENYDGIFDRYLGKLTMLVNCIYWAPQYPRLVTLDALNTVYGIYARAPQPRLRVIGDISCDPQGSIECTVRATDPGNPVYVYDLGRHEAVDGFAGNGPVIMAVEILPTELPRESSKAFGDALLGLVPGLAAAECTERFEDWQLPDPLKRAVILHRGRLTPDYAYIAEFLG